MLKPIFENMPEEFKTRPQWMLWREEPSQSNPEKMTKPPYQPNGRHAKSNDPATWNSFDTVKAAADRFDGVGFVPGGDDDSIGIDFDDCRCPAFDGVTSWAYSLDMVSPDVAGYIRKFNSYAEVSPSSRGIRVFVKGKLPVDGKKKGGFEVYQAKHYLTVTGHVLSGFPRTIEHRQAEVDAFYREVFEAHDEPLQQDIRPQLCISSDGWKNLREKAFKSKRGEEIRRLWDGDHSAYQSQNEADLAFCSDLAFWLRGNEEEIDAAFRESGLMRKKWNDTHESTGRTYGQMTISRAIAGCQSFYEARFPETFAVGTPRNPPPALAWPDPPDEAAYYGLIGEWIRRVLPHTEADPAALLFQALVNFGNMVGRNPHFMVEATEHHCNEFLLLVGNTSKGRKGTSWDHARNIGGLTDPTWASECIKSGLTSGEGLVYHVRDSRTDSKGNLIDEGVDDKRLVAYESEFATILKIIERKENTLSATMRDAWDRGHLRTLAKNSPVKATGSHISIVSHVTKAELMVRLSNTEAFNGFANRFLFACVQRSKILPEGGGTIDLSGIIPRFHQALEFSKDVFEMRRDEEARAVWFGVYEHLTRDQPGILGSVLARDAAHVVRLSMIYALLDCSNTIRKDHLMAALACWEYVEASVRFIFGSMSGDPMSDKIYESACAAGGAGITRTFINNNLFQRNVAAERIEQAIDALVTMGKVRVESSDTGGRREARISVIQ